MTSQATETPPVWAIDHSVTHTVKRSEKDPELEGLSPYKRPVMRAGDPLRFAISTVAEPTSWQGKRGYLITPMPGWSGFEINCDEGTTIGGTDTAPCPLGYFISGIAFCMLTHITAHLSRNPMDIKRIKVEVRGEFWSTIDVAGDNGDAEGGCEAFTCAVIIDSDEPDEKIAHLTEVCRKACMAFETVARAVPTSTTLLLNGNAHPIGAGL